MTDDVVVGRGGSPNLVDDCKAVVALREVLQVYSSNGGIEELLQGSELSEATRGLHPKVLVGYIRSELKALWIRAAGLSNLLRSGFGFGFWLAAARFASPVLNLDVKVGLRSKRNGLRVGLRGRFSVWIDVPGEYDLSFSETLFGGSFFLSDTRYCKGALP